MMLMHGMHQSSHNLFDQFKPNEIQLFSSPIIYPILSGSNSISLSIHFEIIFHLEKVQNKLLIKSIEIIISSSTGNYVLRRSIVDYQNNIRNVFFSIPIVLFYVLQSMIYSTENNSQLHLMLIGLIVLIPMFSFRLSIIERNFRQINVIPIRKQCFVSMVRFSFIFFTLIFLLFSLSGGDQRLLNSFVRNWQKKNVSQRLSLYTK